MQGQSKADGVEEDFLAEVLKAFASPVRIQLLRVLRTPHALGEIQVAPARGPASARATAMNRVSVRAHLEQLIGIGVVRSMHGVRDGRPTTLYQVNHRQLFALTEELRDLSRIRPDQDLAVPDGTQPGPRMTVGQREAGPGFVAVNGVFEGRFFALAGQGPWTIGRRAGLPVSLDYDPYLSQENTVIERDGGSHWVVPLPASRNGTSVNWSPMAEGERHRLQGGDVVGVGRSLLLWRPA